MLEQCVCALAIVMGIFCAWIGSAVAGNRLQSAGRAYRKIEALYETMPDGWSSWFLGGFSELTIGTQYLWAFLAWTSWVFAGGCLMVLGLRLFYHT